LKVSDVFGVSKALGDRWRGVSAGAE
jgi:hypothetical protein